MTDAKQSAAPMRDTVMITRGNRNSISGKQVHAIVARRLRKIDRLSFLESFAFFMGKAQLVELGLKHILIGAYGYDEERIKRWTLGRVVKELGECGASARFRPLDGRIKRTSQLHCTRDAGQQCPAGKMGRWQRPTSCVEISPSWFVFGRTSDCCARFPFWEKRKGIIDLTR
jgi:hypothetical protein